MPYQAFADPQRFQEVLVRLGGVAGEEIKTGLVAVLHLGVEDALLSVHERRQLRQHQLGYRHQVGVTLQHARKFREVGLEPVLLVVLEGRALEIADHLVDVVLQDRHFPIASTVIDRVRSPFVTAVATSAMDRTWS